MTRSLEASAQPSVGVSPETLVGIGQKAYAGVAGVEEAIHGMSDPQLEVLWITASNHMDSTLGNIATLPSEDPEILGMFKFYGAVRKILLSRYTSAIISDRLRVNVSNRNSLKDDAFNRRLHYAAEKEAKFKLSRLLESSEPKKD